MTLEALDNAVDQVENIKDFPSQNYTNLDNIDESYFDYGLAWAYLLPLLVETMLFGACFTNRRHLGPG